MKVLIMVFLGIVFLGPSAYRLLRGYSHQPQPLRDDRKLLGYLRRRPGLETLVYMGLLVAVIMLLHSILSLFDLRVPWFFPILP